MARSPEGAVPVDDSVLACRFLAACVAHIQEVRRVSDDCVHALVGDLSQPFQAVNVVDVVQSHSCVDSSFNLSSAAAWMRCTWRQL